MTVEMTPYEAELLIALLTGAEEALAVANPPLVGALEQLRPWRSALVQCYLRERLSAQAVTSASAARSTDSSPLCPAWKTKHTQEIPMPADAETRSDLVQRYRANSLGGMQPDDEGGYVTFEDYARLVQLVTELEAALLEASKGPEPVAGYRCSDCNRAFYVSGNEEAYACPICGDNTVWPLVGPFIVSARSPEPEPQ